MDRCPSRAPGDHRAPRVVGDDRRRPALAEHPPGGDERTVDVGVVDVEMGHGAHVVGSELAHDHVVLRERRAERPRVGHPEDHDVGLHRGGVELDAGQLGQPLCQAPGARVVVGEALDVVFERMQPGRGDDPGLAHRAPEHLLPAPRLVDEVRGAGEDGADGGSEPLGEVEPRAVERPSPRGRVDPAGDRGVEQPGAVEMGAQRTRTGDLEHPLHLLERPDAPAAQVRRLLDAHQPRARPVASAGAGHAHRVDQSLAREHPALALGDRDDRARKLGRAAALGGEGMGGAPEEDLVAARAHVHANGDLVAHRPAGQEDRGLLAQQQGDRLLEGEDRRVVAQLLVADLGRGHGGAHGVGRARLGVGEEVHAGHCGGAYAGPGGHARILGREMAADTSEGRRTRLAEQRKTLPDGPGVYLFRDAKGRVIYVGKAKSLRKRVAGHFSNPVTRGAYEMVDSIESVEFVLVASESEALLAEQNFIKQYRPKFNIRLRDDKSYPFIAISMDEDFPRVYFTRERHRRDRAYFGPYSNAKRVRGTLDLLGKVFLFRSCNGPEPGRRSGSPCLDYYIKRCEAPCVGYVTKERYREAIDGVIAFLSGRYREIERDLEQRMKDAAANQEFEQAALERNRLRAVRSLLERQRVANEAIGTVDVVAVAVDGTDANAQVFQIRDGVLSDRQSFYLENAVEREAGEVAEEFLLQYYGDQMAIPPQIIVQEETDGLAALAEALTARRGARVEVRTAERGDKRRILELAERNALLALDQERLKAERRRQQRVEALDGLQEALGLDALPLRIECFDISNLMGTHTVASMVVFEGGAPKKSDYRRFTVRGLEEGVPDDVAAMEEILGRRLAQWELQQDRSPHDPKRNESFATLPNLIVIDGGPGQLSAGLRALQGFRDRGVAVVSLAKRIEEVFVAGRREPIVLPHDTPELQLLQRVRDEAHRFAITHHRTRRDRAMTASVLDELPGIGPARKRTLLNRFGSPEAVVAATREELEAVPGLPGKTAREIWARLHRAGD